MNDNAIKLIEIDPYLSPFERDLRLRMEHYSQMHKKLIGSSGNLSDFANGSLYYGFHKAEKGWYYREWAPHAEKMALIGEFNGWDGEVNPMTRLENGNWEVFIPGRGKLRHKSLIKVRVTADGRTFDRIPLYIKRSVQDPETKAFCGQIWSPRTPFQWTDEGFTPAATPLIYECHVGMSSEEGAVATYKHFTKNVLPRIQEEGYNTIQLMAIMEHPYYASFGYQVSSFFAASSRFGTPEELKELINSAHQRGITVLLDLVHSHAATNTLDGINEFDGTDYQFFHGGPLGNHPAWGSKLFNYSKPEVLHFLLSNVKFWLTEYHFDGFRFDGVTSMLYHDHGLGGVFDNYQKYFSMNTDVDAVAYLQLANELIREVKPEAITIAEDMSGMPGMCVPVAEGGFGFDYRLAMGVPDFWIKALSKMRDEDWNMDHMWHELTSRRPAEKNIGYCESHDQALVGDKTIMFWLADQEMYWHMDLESKSPVIDRAVALHKMIRLATFSMAGEGYLNFMGNEFGHPEWIDFPREGNGNSFQYCRRQWSLADDKKLKYQYLLAFDKAMLGLLQRENIFLHGPAQSVYIHNDDKLLACKRGDYLFAFNFHTWKKQQIILPKEAGQAQLILRTDEARFGGPLEDYPEAGKLVFNKDEYGNTLMEINCRTAVVLFLPKSNG